MRRELALTYMTQALTLDPDAVHVVKVQLDTAEYLANSGQSDKALKLLVEARELVNDTSYAAKHHHKRRKEDDGGNATRDSSSAANKDKPAAAGVVAAEDDDEEEAEGEEEEKKDDDDPEEEKIESDAGSDGRSSSAGDAGDDYVTHDDDVIKNIDYGIALLGQELDEEDKKMKARRVPGHIHKVADARAKTLHPGMRLYFVHRSDFNLYCDSCNDDIFLADLDGDIVDPAEITCFRCVEGCSYDICERCIIRRGARLRIGGGGPA